jgi:tetratricopeptide (TPR) repeat protein
VPSELREQLQKALGAAYHVERELGGGGMSRVFLARETAFDRPVVVKVLPPDLAGVSVDRFKREIAVAARLQHPHIVPLISAGEMNGLPYYTMPFVDGESLRHHLAASGPLSVGETVRLLRDIASALAHAHRAGVVHRDIKPDNVMLAGGAATVLDFGVAKAVRDAAGSGDTAHSGLTSLGIALGTPAYMAPEQAAADPGVDHRADLYAFGVMAYEMLVGQTPFGHRPAQELLVAHLTETPVPIAERRDDIPDGLAALITACLAKKPAERPRSADALVAMLDGIGSPGGNATTRAVGWLTPSGMDAPGAGRRAITTYAVAASVTAVLAKLAERVVGLPSWVFRGALGLLAAGLLLMLATAWVSARRRAAGVPSRPGGRARLTWRRATLATGVSLALYSAGVSGWMLTRALGIGPGASLLAAGVIKAQSTVIVTDFRLAGSGDSVLGSVVTEALRTDLSQSKVVSLLQGTTMTRALERMQRDPASKIDLALARDIAQREGAAAVLDGDVTPIGSGVVLAARIVNPATGDILAAFRETATDADGVIPAIDRLSRDVRAKIGDSFRQLQAQPPLDQVSTASLPALRKYTEGIRAIEVANDLRRGIALLEEAVALDSTFAMAYRKLGVVLNNIEPDRGRAMLARAYAFRDRLSPIERGLTDASYFMTLEGGGERARAAFDSVLAIDPTNHTALINSSVLALERRDFAAAEALLQRSVRADSSRAASYSNLAIAQFSLGRTADARRALEVLRRRYPDNPQVDPMLAALDAAVGRYDSAAVRYSALSRRTSVSGIERSSGEFGLGALALLEGRLRAAVPHFQLGYSRSREAGFPASPLQVPLMEAYIDAFFRNAGPAAARRLESALTRTPLAKLPPDQRPHLDLANVYALAGMPAKARALLAAADSTPVEQRADGWEATHASALGEILLAEGKPREAIREFQRADSGACRICVLPRLGAAYDLAGDRDSAIAVFERYRTTPEMFRINVDANFLAGVQKRLGELYEAKGDKARALSAYEQFVTLWRAADPELQPAVQQVRQRIATLRPLVRA